MDDERSSHRVDGKSGTGVTPRRRVGVVLLVVGVLVAALVTAAVLASGDGDDAAPAAASGAAATTTAPSTEPAEGTDSTVGGGASGTETGEIDIVGTSLPPVEGNPDPASDPAVGSIAPALLGTDFAGNPTAVDPTDGSPKAVAFLAHWCPHCQAEVPRVQEWLDSGGGVPGVDIIAVTTAVQPDQGNYPPSAWLAGEGWTSPVIRDNEDSDAFTAYGAGGLPFWVFIDAQGRVVRRSAGELDIALLEQYLLEAGGGASAAPPPVDYAGFRTQPTACGAAAPPETAAIAFASPEDMGIAPTASPVATITTSCGDIVIELDPAAAPATVNSFVFLAEAGYFDGTVTHRVLPGFVVQAGDPTATGTGSPGYVVPDELPPPGTVYTAGTVAMANSGPGTTGSQFFVMLADNDALPPDYTIFGRAVGSDATLEAIASVPLGTNARGEPSTPLETVYIESVTITP